MEINNRTKTGLIPNFYVPPTGGPLYWRNEPTGALPAAIAAYFRRKATDAQLDLLGEYLEYYIHAPCWDIFDNAFADQLEELRRLSKKMRTKKDIHDWIYKALRIGIDPL